MSFLLRHFFPRDESFGYEALRAVGYSNYGGADISEVIAICGRIPAGNEDRWLQEWREAGDRAARNAEASLAVGNKTSAREAFLRASNYYRTAEFYRRRSPADDDVVRALSHSSWTSFVSAAGLMPHAFEEVKIPYEGTTLPGYLVCVDSTASPRPTIIFTGGLDSVMEEAWFAIAAPALKRGFNVLAFDGPGQGRALREQHLALHPDWENVLTPVMDYALGRKEVKADKVFLFGWSLGGYLVGRAITSEHRAAAAVLDDGVLDFSSAFNGQMPPGMGYLLQNRWDSVIEGGASLMMRLSTGQRWAIQNGRWVFGVTSVADMLRKVQDYTLVGRTSMITTPVLILDAPDDHFLQSQPRALYDTLEGNKTFAEVTRHEGGSLHCHQGAFSRLHQMVFDYLTPFL